MPESLHREVLHRLLQVAEQLSASADLQQILRVIIDAMRDLLTAERATVFEFDSQTEELFSTVAHGVGAQGSEIRFPITTGLAGESARTHSIINVPDASADTRFNPEFDRRSGFTTRSLLTIPLADHEGVLVGVAQVLNKRDGTFNKDDEKIAAALAAQAAVAMKRGRLLEDRLIREKLERDLQLARSIQQRSFPAVLPTITGFDIEAWSEPAEQTGGDTYDVVGFNGDDPVVSDGEATVADHAFLLLADATGHGVGPALSVTQVRSMFRMAARLRADLQSILSHVNLQLCDDLPPGRFVTTWLGAIDPETSTLRSLSAGQAPLLHYVAARDDFVVLDADTMPLGIARHAVIPAALQITLAAGDLFAVVSDGVLEAMDASNDQFGLERTCEVLRAAHDRPAKEIARRLRDAVATFTGGLPAADDQTVIVIRRV